MADFIHNGIIHINTGSLMKSFIKTFLKFTSIVIVLFIAFVMLINTTPFDEELSPEVEKIILDIPMPVVEGNAYYAIMGISAQGNKNIVEAGHKLTLRYLENRKNGNDDITSKDYKEILGNTISNGHPWQSEVKHCDKNEFNCLNYLSENITSEYLNKPSLQALLKRYTEISEMKVFSSFIDRTFATPLISYSSMTRLSQVKLASAYKLQNKAEFIKLLHKDLKFWKVLLNQGSLLIDKMVAVSAIKRDLNYLSEYIRDNSIIDSDHILINEMITSLTPNELDFSKSFVAESIAFLNLSDELTKGSESSWYEDFLYQPNATKNIFYEKQIKQQIELGQLSLQELIKVRKSGFVDFDKGFKLHFIYNFLGKTLVQYSAGAYTDYIVRGHDLNNMIKMVAIHYQMKINDQPLQHILSQPENVNMYNGQSFEYDEVSNMLHFKCLAQYQECRIKL